MDIWLVIYRLSGWSQDLIWIIICWHAFRKYQFWQGHYRYFLIYVVSVTVLELIAAISSILISNNLFLDYIYITIEFIAVGLFLKGIIRVTWIDRLVLAASFLFFLFQVMNAFWIRGFENYDSYGSAACNLYLFTLSIWAYTVLTKKKITMSVFSQPESWLVLGLLLVNLSVFIFGFLYDLSFPYKNNNLLYTILVTQNFIKSLCLLLFIKGISKIKRATHFRT